MTIGDNVDDQDEYMRFIRAEFARLMAQPHNERLQIDTAQNIREIRAILATNAEIFNRCMSSLAEINQQDLTPCFYRIDVNEVYTSTYTTYVGQQIKFILQPKRIKKSFDTKVLSDVPPCLKLILTPPFKCEPYSWIIDFELLFKKAVTLHIDLLAPFLIHYKEYLMSVQICLGKIDNWLLEPLQAFHFIESVFGKLSIEWPAFHKRDLVKPQSSRYGRDDSYEEIVIKEYATAGVHEIKFNILEESGQRKLKAFLSFLTECSS